MLLLFQRRSNQQHGLAALASMGIYNHVSMCVNQEWRRGVKAGLGGLGLEAVVVGPGSTPATRRR
jgi:hypothetical protein